MPSHTAKDAQQLRCCGPEGTGSLKYGGEGEGYRRFCIADDCMAWRWVEEFFDRPTQGKLYPVNRGRYAIREDGSRGEWIDEWEQHPRLPACKDWPRYEIMEEEREPDEYAPHYWEETPQQAAERFAKAMGERRGYCGYARRPRHD